MEKKKSQKKSRRDKKRSKRQRSRRSRRVNKVKCIPRPKYKVYCGKKDALPLGYDRFGERYECLKKGFGVGSVVENKKLRGEVRQQGYEIDLYEYPEYCKN
jgi:hypothetical protein